MYGTITYREIAKILCRSMSSVEGKAKDMQLSYYEIETPQLFKANIRINKLGKNDRIPLMPGLLDLLNSMSGCMGPTTPQVTKNRLADTMQSQIKRMLASGMTGNAIAHEIGVPKSTLYRHIKEMRA
jgi:IS30 family transposase